MRLLKFEENGCLSFAEFNEGTKPPYAILSHRWGAEGTEVTFEDLQGNKGEDKLGYEKIRLCGYQAQRDGLEYFWVDTCCINKANKAELSRAIQSMFRWYRDSARCYVYLSDVSSLPLDTTLTSGLQKSKVQNSEWFTRGWTLQELLAPSSVDFFSQEWEKLGDRKSLIQQVHEATGIPYLALQGGALSQFSVSDRLRWIEYRHTTCPEDKAYSLAGVVDIDLAPCYGEGVEGAFRRLHDEIDKSTRCIQDLCGTDSRKDKQRIEEMKGGLLTDAYSWIFHNDSYMNWYTDPESRVLWIKGDPGKGKTMLLCGIINELETSTPMRNTKLVSYFFCQANDPRINSATAVLRGLLYSLVNQQPSLVSCVRKKYDHIGRKVFEDANAWITLEDIFADVLQNPDLPPTTHLIIDGLDEVFELAKRNNYDERTQHAVLDHLTLNANDTFLWVALACQHLQVTARRNVLRKLQSFPSGLDALYERMMQQISRKDDAELCKQVLAAVTLVYRPITLNELVTLVAPLEDLTSNAELQEIIGLCGSFLTLREQTLHFVHQSAKDFLLAKATQEIFPAGQEAVHQAIFARSLQVMSTTLQRDMYRLRAIGTLIEDVKKPKPDPLAAISYSCIYWIDHLCESKPIASTPDAEHLRDGGLVDQFLKKTFLYWLESLSLCKSMSYGVVSMNKLHMLAQEQGETTSLTRLVYDAYRFIMYHRQTIEISPLQTYISALLFSPTDSLIRKSYHHEAPEYISFTTTMASTWDACLQTLEGHRGTVSSVAFSHDSSRIVSGSFDRTAKIWDASSGACLLTLRDHDEAVSSVAFSHNSSRVVSGSHDTTAKIWDTNSGACLLTFRGHSKYVCSVAFSYDSSWIASGSGDFTVKIWNSNNGECIQKLEHGGTVRSVMVWDLNEGQPLKTFGDVDNDFKSVFFSHDCTRVALITSDLEESNISVLDLDTGEWLKTLRVQDSAVHSVTFSRNSTQLISGSISGSIKIWDVTTGECLRTYKGDSLRVISMAFSHDSAHLVSGSDDGTIRIWDAISIASLRTPRNHNVEVRSLDFSPDSALLASAFSNDTIKIWHVSSGKCLQTLKYHDYKGIENKDIKHEISSMTFSHDSILLASGSQDGVIKIWNVSNGKCLHTLLNNGHVRLVVFSRNSTCLASVSLTLEGLTSKLWDLSSGKCIQNFTFYDLWRTGGYFGPVAMSHDLSMIAVLSYTPKIRIWHTWNGKRLQTLESHRKGVVSIAFSHDSTLLASGSPDNTVNIWDIKRGVCLQTYTTETYISKMKFENAGPYLHIGIGTINISAALDVSSLSNNSKPCVPRFHGVSGTKFDLGETWDRVREYYCFLQQFRNRVDIQSRRR
ncbi:hypothetical protein BM1_04970 [Bipolaris maydis]|nr:hypothetical protein BM1_04970 [Bipolaris maydis]